MVISHEGVPLKLRRSLTHGSPAAASEASRGRLEPQVMGRAGRRKLTHSSARIERLVAPASRTRATRASRGISAAPHLRSPCTSRLRPSAAPMRQEHTRLRFRFAPSHQRNGRRPLCWLAAPQRRLEPLPEASQLHVSDFQDERHRPDP